MLQKGDKIGDYTLVRFLGRGQFGVVWLAEKEIQFSTRKFQHALKFLSSFGDEVTLKSVQAEIDTWIEASGHPNVMSVLDMLVHEDHVVIASEFADGGSLMGWLKKTGGKAPTQESALEMMTGILSGIEHLHSRMVVHRDLKPDNILLQGDCPRITDFGISRIISANSMSAVAMGSPFYMSPESFDGNKLPQTDIWSAGVMMYEMLTGAHPYTSDTMYGLVASIRNEDPTPLPDNVPPDIRLVVQQALQKDLAIRFQTAREMRSAIEQEMYNLKARSSDHSGSGKLVGLEQYIDQARAVTLVNHQLDQTAPYPIPDPDEQSQPAPEVVPNIMAAATEQLPGIPEIESSDHAVVEPEVPAFNENLGKSQSATPTKLLFIGGVAGAVTLVLILGIVAVVVVSRAIYFRASAPEEVELSGDEPTKGDLLKGAIGVPSGMVYIEGGEFTMGRDAGLPEERPAHKAVVQPFFIDIHEVTNQDYAEFVKATDRRSPPGWTGSTYPVGEAKYPVVGVNWDDAAEFAKWKGKRLPTEEEWEFAARGKDGRLYPWGEEWLPDLANADGAQRSFSEVGRFPGASPFGVFDMVGNAAEWTADDFKAYPSGSLSPTYEGMRDLKTVRGNSYDAGKEYSTVTYRFGWAAKGAPTYNIIGFRCARGIADTPDIGRPGIK